MSGLVDHSGIRELVVEASSIVAGYLRDIAGSQELADYMGRGAGGDTSYRADILAEEILIDFLRKEHFPARIVTEEKGVVDIVSKPEYLVLVDPLDGSLNYVSMIPYASVSIAVALVRKPFFSQVIAGCVSNIFLRETYSFSIENGVWVNGVRVEEPLCSGRAFIVYSSNPELYRVAAEYVRENREYKLRILGSAALELCYSVLGRTAIYYNDSGKLRNIDVVAGAGFVRRLRGAVVDRYGRELDFRLDGLYRISSIVAGCRENVYRFIEYIRGRGYVVDS